MFESLRGLLGKEKFAIEPTVTLFGSMNKWRDPVIKQLRKMGVRYYDPGGKDAQGDDLYNGTTGTHHEKEAQALADNSVNVARLGAERESTISCFEAGMASLYAGIDPQKKRAIISIAHADATLPDAAQRARAYARAYPEILERIMPKAGVDSRVIARVGEENITAAIRNMLRLQARETTSPERSSLELRIKSIFVTGSQLRMDEKGDTAVPWKEQARSIYKESGISIYDPAAQDVVGDVWKGEAAPVRGPEPISRTVGPAVGAAIEAGKLETAVAPVVLACIPRGLNQDYEPAGTGALAALSFQLAVAYQQERKVVVYVEKPDDYPFEIPQPPKGFVEKNGVDAEAKWKKLWKENIQLRHTVRAHLAAFEKKYPDAYRKVLILAESPEDAIEKAQGILEENEALSGHDTGTKR